MRRGLSKSQLQKLRSLPWFGQIKLEDRLSPAEHVQTAERLAKEHGVLPGGGWLTKHGYGATYACLGKYPELFAHIPRHNNRLDHKTFEEARDLTRAQGFNDNKEYRAWANTVLGMPSSPHSVYKEEGWAGWGDFLGTGSCPKWLPLREAKALVRSEEIRTLAQFKSWPDRLAHRIPSNPNISYKDDGWTDWHDFFGGEYTSGPRPKTVAIEHNLKQVVEAEQLAQERGILPSNRQLLNEKRHVLARCMKKHPELFAHIPRYKRPTRGFAKCHPDRKDVARGLCSRCYDRKRRPGQRVSKSKAKHVTTAEQLAGENGGLPRQVWLKKNGYSALCQYMRLHPDLFAHIPRAGKHIPEVPEEAGISI